MKETSGKIRNILLVLLIAALAIFFYRKCQSDADILARERAEAEAQLEALDETTFEDESDSKISKNEKRSTTTQANQPNEEQQELRADAKSMLASAYTMMVAVNSEFGRYTSDLSSSMVYEGDVLDMKAGFLEVYRPQEIFPQENPERKDTDFFVRASQNADKPVKYSESAEKIDLMSLSQYCDKKCEASEREFEYIVAVNLDDDPELDVWTINERKELIHRFDDMTNELQK